MDSERVIELNRLWICAVDNARLCLELHNMEVTAAAIWSTICYQCGCVTLSDLDFFGKTYRANYYATEALASVQQYPMIRTPACMQMVLNASHQTNPDYIVNELVPSEKWFKSVDGGPVTVTEQAVRDYNSNPFGEACGAISQSKEAKETHTAKMSLSQARRLDRNKVHLFLRPNHALFMELHPSAGDIAINDPNHSSLQVLELQYRQRLNVNAWPINKPPITTPFGLCQTWSAFELECNMMGVAGLHQQLLMRYVDYALSNRRRWYAQACEMSRSIVSEVVETETLKIMLQNGPLTPDSNERLYGASNTEMATRNCTLTILVNFLVRRLARIFLYEYPENATD